MFRVVVVYSRSLSGFLLGGSWCGYAFVVLSWGAKCGWGLWVLVAWTVVGVCAMVVVKMVFHFCLFMVIPLSLGGLRGITVSGG